MIFFYLIFQLISCGSSGSDGGIELVSEDTIADYPLNEDRLTAVEFNNELTLMQEDAIQQITVLFQSDTASVQRNYENTLFELEIYQSNIREMQKEGLGEDYLDEMQKLIAFYETELKTGFVEILPLLKKANLTNEDLDRLEVYDKNFAAKEKAAFESVFQAQEAFADTHNIKLQDHR
ncbi:MAG: hypothetical protein WDZ35_14860 [Crocinitomicaceae bacterium]